MNPPTFSEHLLSERLHGKVPPELADLLELLASTFISIGDMVRTRPRTDGPRNRGATNPTGDIVHRLDLAAHAAISEALQTSGLVGCFASEEAAGLLQSEATETGPYCVVFDPLDGSNNLDSNGPVASIFGIFPRRTPTGAPCTEADLLRPGTELVAAGYALFSASTQFVLSTGRGVASFTLDDHGDLRMSHPELQIPDPGRRIFSVNDGHTHKWDPRVQDYVDTLRRGGYTARYVGTMAADVHRLIRHGGIYMHPADTTGSAERGKLRLLFEAIPLGLIVENAGGMATDGHAAILDLVPETLHAQRPIVFGTTTEVKRFMEHTSSRAEPVV